MTHSDESAAEPRVVFEPFPDLEDAWQEFCLFEPRRHGWARWEYVIYVPYAPGLAIRDVVAKGWTRRRRGAAYVCINTRRAAALPKPFEEGV